MDMAKSLKGLGDLDLIFKVTLENQIAKFRPKIPKCTLSSELTCGFYTNLHEFNIWTVQLTNKILETLTLFSRSHKNKNC